MQGTDTVSQTGTLPRPDLPATTASRRSLSVIIPLLNEENGIGRLVAALEAVLAGLDVDWDVIFVDDGSTDSTLEMLRDLNARDPRYRTVALSRNFGKELAVAAGLAYTTADAAVLMDADLQHPPEVIGEFVARWRQGYDVVFGQRDDRAADARLRRIGSAFYYSLFRWMSGTTLPPGAGDFRLMDRKAVEAMNSFRERVRFNKGIYAWMGFKSIGVPFHVPPREGGASRWRPRQLWRFAIDGFASFSTIPLRVWSYLGVVISVIALVYAAVFMVKTLIFGVDVPGFPSLLISVLFFAGVQLISLGVIGEYLGRMYEEVKGRPLFLVREELGIHRPKPPTGP